MAINQEHDMKTITMTQEQTSIYDDGDDQQVKKLLTELRADATAAREDGETIEIQTIDGITVDIIQD
jgi:hypothetical protein